MPTLAQMQDQNEILKEIFKTNCLHCGSPMRYKKGSTPYINCYACDQKEREELVKLPNYYESVERSSKNHKLPGKRQKIQKSLIEKYGSQDI